ncbi:TPA: phage antirepressor Ant [Escherichia coli]|nr:phage antirepressor Ant [Escherichia coli]
MTSIAILEAVNTTYVPFNGQQILTAMAAGVAYVAMKPIVENLGMSWSTQVRKLSATAEKFNCVHMNMVASDNKLRDVLCLPLKKLNGWLFSINPEKVRADIRDKLIQYQEECFTVLHDYWNKGEATNPRKATTAPGKITKEQQTTIKELVMSRGHSLPKDKQAKAIITMWSALKTHFGLTYKEINDDQFEEAISLVSRLPLEGELIEAPKVSGVTIPAGEVNTLIWLWDYANRDQAVFRELQRPMREIQSHYAGKCHDYGVEFATVINLSRDVLSKLSHEVDMERADGTTNLSAWKRLQGNELPPSFLLK